MAPKRRRSERGPQLVWRRVRGRMESGVLTWNAIQSEPVQVVSRAVRALLELPDTIVAEILRLVNWRFLEYTPGPTFLVQQKGWSGTQRMLNRRRLISRYVSDNKRVRWMQEITDLKLLRSDAPIDVD